MKITNFKLKISSLLFFIPLLLFTFSLQVSAASNFTTDYKAVYTVSESGITHSEVEVTLVNTTKDFYASSYQMALGFDDISNLKAKDALGDIKTTLKETDAGYDLSLQLNQKSVGLGNKLTFNLTFDTGSVARNSGGNWQVNIPGMSNPADYKSIEIEVKVPTAFGDPSFVKPESKENSLIFNKDQLGLSGISIGFGKQQSYAFNLKYHIKNSNLYPIKKEIALPPDTNYQNIYITDIIPRPLNVRVDEDGNWLAEYSLYPTQSVNITVKGTANIRLDPEQVKLSSAGRELYTKPTKYWQADDTRIKELASKLKTPNAIYSHVTNTLKYDFERATKDAQRIGAVNSLKKPALAVCREFTDLFIAIARSSGIPAREVNGFANTKNFAKQPISPASDVLHAWPEYYDDEKKTWIMIDPTWGATTGGVDYFNKLDYDHFAFVIKGIDDSYPIPAGGYKSDKSDNVKYVSVLPGKVFENTNQKIEIKTSIKEQIAGLPINSKMKIHNLGPGALVSKSFLVSTKDVSPENQMSALSDIPPFGTAMVDVSFDGTNFLTNKEALITMQISDYKKTERFKITPFFLNPWGLGGVAIVIFTSIILIIAGKSGRIRLFR